MKRILVYRSSHKTILNLQQVCVITSVSFIYFFDFKQVFPSFPPWVSPNTHQRSLESKLPRSLLKVRIRSTRPIPRSAQKNMTAGCRQQKLLKIRMFLIQHHFLLQFFVVLVCSLKLKSAKWFNFWANDFPVLNIDIFPKGRGW